MPAKKTPSLSEHIQLARDIHAAEDAISKLTHPQMLRFVRKDLINQLIEARDCTIYKMKMQFNNSLFTSFDLDEVKWKRLYFGTSLELDALEAEVKNSKSKLGLREARQKWLDDRARSRARKA